MDRMGMHAQAHAPPKSPPTLGRTRPRPDRSPVSVTRCPQYDGEGPKMKLRQVTALCDYRVSYAKLDPKSGLTSRSLLAG